MMRGERIRISLKAGNHRPASENGPTLNAGLVAMCISSIAKDPYSFVIFHGGMDPPVPPLDPCIVSDVACIGVIRVCAFTGVYLLDFF